MLHAIEHCRTSTLGGHLDRCSRCGHRAISFNSCRNRHCPKCQTSARDKWLAERSRELLPVGYVHVVFTIPHELSWLALQNKKVVYDLLFRTSAATLLEVAADRKASRRRDRLPECASHLGPESSASSACPLRDPRRWSLARRHQHWVRLRYAFFLPVKVLSRVFRGKFIAGLKRAFRDGELSFPGSIRHLADEKAFHSFLRSLFRHDWVVYAKRPFGGPEHVLHYLARYTHRVAISNHRLVNVADGKVTFRWKDYARGSRQRTMTVGGEEFLRRFLLHVLPRGFVRIRFFGFLANRRRTQLLPLCQRLLEAISHQSLPAPQAGETKLPASWLCPHCGGAMVLIEKFTAQEIRWKSAKASHFVDSS